KAFQPMLDYLEGKNKAPADEDISDVLRKFNEDGVHAVWIKALERRHTDPDGAITSARTLLETVCKHILDDMGIQYNNKNIEMSELYKTLSKELNLSADQHTENIFKQILGGCSAVVNGLGTLRNKLGDAHGTNSSSIKPSPRHAELAVNLSGSMALFLINTWLNLKDGK
ncbi:abortive infection family protein, partial [Escherichia coli]